MAKVGYSRVSTQDQHPEAQSQRLEAAGCERIFTDKGASGAKASRPEWDKCLAYLRPGDALVCVKLDRIGRSVQNLVDVVANLGERKIDLIVLDQAIDTTTASGKLLFHIMAAVAEFERSLIVERTKDGLKATKTRGHSGGRKPRLTPEQVQLAKELHSNGWSIGRIQDALTNGGKPIGKTTIYRALGMTTEEAETYTLTREEAVRARDLHAQGFSVEYIQKALTVEGRRPSEAAIRGVLPGTDRSAVAPGKAINNRRLWSPADLEIVRRPDLNVEQAAKILGRTVHAIEQKRAKLNEQEQAS